MPFRRALDEAQDGTATGILPINDVPERRQAFWLSPPIVHSAYAFFAPEGSPFTYAKPADVTGRQIGAYGPSATSLVAEAIAKEGGGRMVLELTNLTVLRKLAAGHYGPDGVGFANLEVGTYLLKSQRITGVKPAGVARAFDYTIGLSRRAMTEDQADAFSAAVARLRGTGKLAEILARYDLQPPAQ